MKRVRIFGAVAAVLVVVLTGCSGSSDSGVVTLTDSGSAAVVLKFNNGKMAKDLPVGAIPMPPADDLPMALKKRIRTADLQFANWDWSEWLGYALTFQNGTASGIFPLNVGKYHLYASANSRVGIPLYSGETDLKIEAGRTAQANVEMEISKGFGVEAKILNMPGNWSRQTKEGMPPSLWYAVDIFYTSIRGVTLYNSSSAYVDAKGSLNFPIAMRFHDDNEAIDPTAKFKFSIRDDSGVSYGCEYFVDVINIIDAMDEGREIMFEYPAQGNVSIIIQF